MAGTSGLSNSIYEIVFRLNAFVTPAFRRSVEEAEHQVQDLDQVLREMVRRGYFDTLRRDAEQADDTIDDLSENAGGFGDTLKEAVGKLDFSQLQKAVGPLKAVMAIVNESSDAMAQLQAATGMTTEQMEGMNEISKDLYSQNYGKSFEDIGESMGVVKQVLQQTGNELEKTTQTAMTYRDVFKGDLPDSIKAVDSMMRKFGISSEQSYNLMAQGAQKGLNKSGELLDTASKYSVYFDNMGYSANEMFDLFSVGMENGATSLEGVADTVKEFGTTIKNGSQSTKDTIYELFAPEQLKKFSAALVSGGTKSKEFAQLVKAAGKASTAALVGDLKAGGDSANKAMLQLQKTLGTGDKIFKGLADGSMTGKQAMEQVILKLKGIKDPIHQAQLAGSLFGSQFEDMGSEAVLALGQTRSEFDMTKKTMEEVAAVKYNTLSQQFAAVGRELMTELVIPLGESLMPMLQEVAHWMSNNKELMMVIGLAAPAAVLATKTVKIVKAFSNIGAAAEGAGSAAGGFAGALGLLTSPVGITAAAVGVLTLGIIAYKNHQEEARQELIHMGERLDEVGAKYQEAKDKAKLTNDLIWQYDDLSKKIATASTKSGDMAVNSEKLAGQQERIKDVTQKLQDMYPEFLDNHTVENGKLSEKLSLAKQIADAEERSYRLKQEQTIAEGNRDLPDTVKLIKNYRSEEKGLADQKDAIDNTVSRFIELQSQVSSILQQPTSIDRNTQLEFLLKKVNDIASDIGLSVLSMNDLMHGGMQDARTELYAKQAKVAKKNNTVDENLNSTTASYETLYYAEKEVLDRGLGGKLEDMVKKFSSLSETQKNKTLETVSAVHELNKQFNLMPQSKQVNIELLYSQMGKYFPNAPEKVADITNSLLPKQFQVNQKPKQFQMNQYAEYAGGGIANVPSIFGEAGPEIAIPLNRKPRSRSLLEKANDLMGYSDGFSGKGDIHVTWAPNISLQGGDKSVVEQLREALKQSENSFERRFKAMVQQQRRVSFQ
ncbi:hypothetical protein A3842_28120 [Paenibacillus sp. P3E]|uniref:phage tail tape measure protein n=1 Tax=Paenibacillus sp. P3E TaxID=1349435 RepID=UPI000939DB2D|nr:phage tail tape measure protein [Paenibacillus sp. P3E]OKP67570.1 hypothetical protein A3842_28120 [Paenibacillus sp. P3E]